MSQRIPFAQVQSDGVVSVSAPPLMSLSAAAANSGAPMLQALGGAVSLGAEVADRINKARQSVAVSDALTDASTTLADYRDELSRDPDTAAREAKFAAKLAEVKASAGEKITDRDAADQFSIRYNQMFRPMQLQVKQQARAEDIQNFKVALGDNLDTLANRAVFAKSAQERIAIQAEAKKAIVDAVATGRINAAGAHQYQKAFLGNVDASLAGEMVRTNPGGAIAALGDPNQFPNLDAARRVQLRAQAQQRSESLGVQARAELRADSAEFIGDLQRGATTGQMPSEQEFKALRARAGNSAEGVRLQKAWDFYTQVSGASDGRSIPQLQATVSQLKTGIEPTGGNLAEADKALNLTPQERALYGRHLTNLYGSGGVDNKDGSRSTLYQMSTEIDGRTYNLPTVYDGKIVSPDEAVDRARKAGLDNFPSYANQQEAEARYQAMHGFMEKDTAAFLQARANGPTAQQLHKARVLETALQHKIAARDKDPAAYALSAYPTISEQLQNADKLAASPDAGQQTMAEELRRHAWASLVDAQRREGVPENRIALLPKAAGEDLKQRLLTSEGQQRVDLVDQMRTQFGDQWPRIVNQLWGGKPAPPDVQVLSALPADANLPKVTIAEASKITDEQASKVLGGPRITSLSDAVRDQAAAMATTMAQAPGGPQFIASFQTMAEKVARLYAIRGEGSDSAAAQRAVNDVFYDHWDTVGTVRVPKSQGVPVAAAGDIRTAQADVMAALPKLDLAVPGGADGTTEAQRRDMLVRAVRSNGYWMTTADDKGMVLMAGPGLPVLFADHRPLILPFDSINAAAAERGAQAALQRRIAGSAGDNAAFGRTTDLGSDADTGVVKTLPLALQRFLVNIGRLPGEAAAIEGGAAP